MLSSSDLSSTKKDEYLKNSNKKIENSNSTKHVKKNCNNISKVNKGLNQNNKVKNEKNNKKKKIKKGNSSSKTTVKEMIDEDEEEEDKDNICADARKYFKEGQKIITPPNGDGTRAFYESLFEENPNSVIAIKYCIEHGVLSGTKHHEALYKYFILKKNNAFKSNFGGIKSEFLKLLEDSCKNEKCSYEELIKKEILSK
ncbi:conserved protein, unknown function [Plasmodium gallinaceum]|uniref:Uncharacterized protein n=1 Tax=Plasmodium gallinaceum TaxID=5849 RepID=A0A1J1GUK5_PLAGA|nr:conserved protein, unknown function [Plasmodium gallinaceum]CRG95985.1 conserved protein, unknown function [Plasmodium gallinaceum]